VLGTYDDVQVAFGLKERTESPGRGLNIEQLGSPSIHPPKITNSHGGGGHNKNKAKNKSAKQSRKKNRRRK